MTAAERVVLRIARPWLGRLLGAGLLAAGTELAGLALMATATWLLITAAGQPPVAALTVAIVAVRTLAIARGVLRYTERLAGHDAVLRIITDVRARIFATLSTRPARATDRSGDALSRLVSDVDAVQDLLLRVLVPGAAAGLVAVLSVLGAGLLSPLAALPAGRRAAAGRRRAALGGLGADPAHGRRGGAAARRAGGRRDRPDRRRRRPGRVRRDLPGRWRQPPGAPPRWPGWSGGWP